MVEDMARLRGVALVVACIYISFAVSTEVEEMVEDTVVLRPTSEKKAFNEVEGFAMRSGATTHPNKSLPHCENLCLKEKECRSFSYRLKDKMCIISTSSLTFDPDFMFASKTGNSKNHMWRKFAGMSYRTQGWTIVAGLDHKGCEDICAKNKGCKAYSYRGKDKLCLLGPKGIVHSQDFNYYEKKGMPYKPFPLLPPGAKFKCTGSLCAKPAAGAADESDPTKNAAVKAMEGAEKARMKVAARDLREAKAAEQKARATIARDKLKANEKIAKLRAKDESELTDAERAMLRKADEKMAKSEETMKLQFATSEIKEKANSAGNSAARMNERATKGAYKLDERSKRAAEREMKAGHQATDMDLEKLAANDAEFAAVHKMMKAKIAKSDADMLKIKDSSKLSSLKEVEQKKIAGGAKELAKKKSS